MIDRKTFHKWMDRLVEAGEIVDTISECDYFSDKLVESLCRVFDLPIDLVSDLMGDTDGWISFWLFELERGKKFDEGSIVDRDGKPVSVKTIDDLYDRIMEEKK